MGELDKDKEEIKSKLVKKLHLDLFIFTQYLHFWNLNTYDMKNINKLTAYKKNLTLSACDRQYRLLWS